MNQGTAAATTPITVSDVTISELNAIKAELRDYIQVDDLYPKFIANPLFFDALQSTQLFSTGPSIWSEISAGSAMMD